MNKNLFLLFFLIVNSAIATDLGDDNGKKLVCVGRIEPVDGEVEMSSQMSGTLTAICVREGDWVTNGTVLAEIDAPKEKAMLDLAQAKLARVEAGNGKEEIAAAEANRDAVTAESTFADSDFDRTMKLSRQNVVSEDELEKKRQDADMLHKQVVSAERNLEALRRGPLPEDVTLAKAEVSSAQATYDLHRVRADTDGFILEIHRHAGDFVAVDFPTPILRMANIRKLQARIEINERDVYLMKVGMRGEFTTFGANQPGGQLVVKNILPAFAPRRLFEPDSTARIDTRTLQVLCEVVGEAKIYSGQRITATFKLIEGK